MGIDLAIGGPEIVEMLAYAAYLSRGLLALWSLFMAGAALLAAVLGVRGLMLRAVVSGGVAWGLALVGCFLQPGSVSPTAGFFFDRPATVVVLVVALPLWGVAYEVKRLREGRRGREGDVDG